MSLTHFRHFRGELSFILHTQDGPMYKQQFPMFNSTWPKIGLGPFLYSGTQLVYILIYCVYILCVQVCMRERTSAFVVNTIPEISAVQGTDVKLPCTTDADSATVYWYYGSDMQDTTLVANIFKGAAYPRRDNIEIELDYTLHFNQIGFSHAGVYQCVVVPSPSGGPRKNSSTLLIVTGIFSTRS